MTLPEAGRFGDTIPIVFHKRHCLQHGQREGQFKLIALQYQSDCAFPFTDFRADAPRDRPR